MIYITVFVIIYFLHILLKLNIWIVLALGIYALIMIPMHRKWHQKSRMNQKRFQEAALYLDTLLYAFAKEEKVDLAVRDVCQTIPEGRMKNRISAALDYMTMTFDETEVLEEALGMIEKEFPCKRIKDVHRFMLHVEYYGGEIGKPVTLLLTDRERWENVIKEAIAGRKKQFTDIVLSVIASLLICSAIIYLPVTDMDISREWILQIFAFLVIAADDLVILLGQKYLAADWIELQLDEKEEYYVKKMESYRNYDEKKEKKLSAILGIAGIVITVFAFLYGNKWLVAAALALTLIFFQQHKVGRKLMEKSLTRQIKYAFPNWLLDLVLLLQSENVQVALQKSQEYVPGVLRRELYLLTERLEMQPEDAGPYHKFLAHFPIPEVHSAMGILYSLSIGNSGNADKQISELVEKNMELLDLTETELLKDSAAGMYVLFLLPVLAASFKLVADMVVLMMHFMQGMML